MKHIVSFSGGKDSTELVCGMKERGMIIDEMIMCDTGVEFPEMYDHIKKVEAYMGMQVTILKADNSFEYYLLQHEKINSKNEEHIATLGYGFSSMQNRWCTTKLKLQVFNRYIKLKYGNEKIIQYHGIAADERRRMKKHTYPLVEWGITEKQALQNCYDRGFDWGGLYKKFKRVSCWCCPLQSLAELKVLYRDYPLYWEKLKEWEGLSFNNLRADYTLECLERRFQKEVWMDEHQLSLFVG